MKKDPPFLYKGILIKNQSQLFNIVWEEREHLSELTSSPLLPKGNFKWHFQFGHILGKGKYSKYKLNPDNIILMTPEEHDKQETYPAFIERQDEIRREYLIKYEGKEF